MPIYALGDRVPHVHPEAFLHPEAVIIGAVVIRAHTSVWPGAVVRGDHGAIDVGEYVAIQDGTVVHGNVAQDTRLGDRTVIGHLAHLEGCWVGTRCLIGSGSIVLPGAAIGDETVVGAGAVVPRGMRVPAMSTALGVPARVRDEGRGRRKVDDTVRRHAELAREYRDELRVVPAGAWPPPNEG